MPRVLVSTIDAIAHNLPELTVTGSASYTVPSNKMGIVRVKAGAAAFTINGIEKLPKKILADTSTTIIHYANGSRPSGVAYSCYTATSDCVAILRGRHTANSIVEEGFLINDWYALRWTATVSGGTTTSGWDTFNLRSGDVVKIWHHTATGSGDAVYYWTIYSSEGYSGTEKAFTVSSGDTISGGDYILEIFAV